MGPKNKVFNILVLGLVLISNNALSAENKFKYDNKVDKENNEISIEMIKRRLTNEIDDTIKCLHGQVETDQVSEVKSNQVKTDLSINEIYDANYLKDMRLRDNSKTAYNKNTKEITNQINDKMYSIDDTELESPEIIMINEIIDIRKRSIEEKYEIANPNMTTETNLTEELCIGAEEYCNMSREEYVQMLNNYIYPHTFEWVLIVTHTLVFVGGLLGNALVCVAVYRNHSMRTVTNYFIVNLALADFMVILFCLPPTVLWDVTETWFFGAIMCKIILYFQSVSVTVSVLTLTFISVDRWYAICFPLKFKSTTGRAKVAILVIWAISLTLNAPELVILTTAQSVPLRFELEYLVQCIATWSLQSDLIWHIIKVVFIYTIPLMLMTVAHYQIVKVLWRSEKIPGQADTAKLAPAERSQLRSRRKAAKMLAAVVVMFAVCYFPVHLLSMLRYTVDMEQTDVVTCLALISHVLCYANSAINPLIYNFMSGKFRREFRRAFCCSVEPVLENSTTLSRLTISKKKPCELVPLDSKRYRQGYVCKSTMF